MIEDVMPGLKNALDRGDSMESAVQSFINAGYDPEEVRQASKMLLSGTDPYTLKQTQQPQTQSPNDLPKAPGQTKQTQQNQQSQQNTQNQHQQNNQQNEDQKKTQNQQNQQRQSPIIKPKKSGSFKWIVISLIALILLLGSLIVFLVFREQIIDMLSGLF